MELTTSLKETSQSRWACESSLEIFIKPYLRHAHRKIHSSEMCSRSSLSMVVHVFYRSPVRLPCVRGGIDKRGHLVSSPLGRLAAWPNRWKPSLDGLCWYIDKTRTTRPLWIFGNLPAGIKGFEFWLGLPKLICEALQAKTAFQSKGTTFCPNFNVYSCPQHVKLHDVN